MNLLFETPLIDGLRYAERAISAAEERALLDRLMPLELAPFRFHGWLGNRRTHSFGWRYDFDDSSFTPGEPIPDWLLPVRARAASFAGMEADDFVQTLIARYDPGAGIGWHRDRDVFENVVGISLKSNATLRFRQRTSSGFRRANLEVSPGSAYFLSGEARRDWEHSISPGDQLRFSITFRSLSEKGRRIAGERSTERRRSETSLGSVVHRSILCLLLLAGCSAGPEADLQYIKQARSLGAEWALVNEQANKGQLTQIYVRSMHQWLRQNLQTTSMSLTQPDSRYGQEIRALLAQPDDAAPDELRAHSDVLKHIEDSLESA